MQSSALRASANADVPPPPGVRLALAGASLFALALLFFFGDRTLRPSIRGFALPARALAGAPATASYDLGGLGGGRYSVRFGNVVVESGNVATGRGSFTFPTSVRPGAYRVTLAASGPLGSDARSLYLRTSAQVALGPPAIQQLSVDPGVAVSGSPVAVRYATNAESGSVALFGAGGIALERAPYNRTGVSMMLAPPVAAPTQYEVTLDVKNGNDAGSASVGLLVIPQALATPEPAPSVPQGMLTAGELLRLPDHAVAGGTFAVQLLAHPSDLTISLVNPTGTTVSSEPVSATAASVQMLAPQGAMDERYLVVAKFTSGTADQVLIAPIVIYSR